jgi:hypothetical protein
MKKCTLPIDDRRSACCIKINTKQGGRQDEKASIVRLGCCGLFDISGGRGFDVLFGPWG